MDPDKTGIVTINIKLFLGHSPHPTQPIILFDLISTHHPSFSITTILDYRRRLFFIHLGYLKGSSRIVWQATDPRSILHISTTSISSISSIIYIISIKLQTQQQITIQISNQTGWNLTRFRLEYISHGSD